MTQFTGLEEAKHSKTHQKVCLYTIFTLILIMFFFLNSCVLVFFLRIHGFLTAGAPVPMVFTAYSTAAVSPAPRQLEDAKRRKGESS